MIVSEKQYQDLYLVDDISHRGYRDALALAFEGNPILFIGLGMKEPDLLRPLRQFVSEAEQHAIHQRPLFALWPRIANRVDRYEFRRFLYRRYGVKVYFYKSSDDDRTLSLCAAIVDIEREWRKWWLRWQEKLPIRFPRFGVKGQSMIHHRQPQPVTEFNSEDKRIVEQLTKSKVVLVLGRPGTGKGSLGQRLVEEQVAKTGKKWKLGFYSSTHFSNEFLSTLESATEFILNPIEQAGVALPRDPLKRFELALEDPGALVVIGGLERLFELAPAQRAEVARFREDDARPPLPVGVPASAEAQRFLECVEQHARKETDGAALVLLSSVQPIQTRFKGGAPVGYRPLKCVAHFHLHGLSQEDVKALPGFDGVTRVLVDQFHHAIRGHAYAVVVANEALLGVEGDGLRCEWLEALVSHLTAAGLSQRTELVVGKAIKALQYRSGSGQSFPYRVLQTIALSTTPVTVSAVVSMLGECDAERVARVVEDLTKRRLLLLIEHEKGNHEFKRYTAHTLVRTYVLHSLGGLPDISGEPQRFDLAGFSKDPQEPSVHGVAGTLLHETSADNLLAMSESVPTRLPTDCDSGQISDEFRNWRTLIRTAFGIIRSRWSATAIGRSTSEPSGPSTIPRMSHYDAYQKRLARVLNTSRSLLRDHLWYDEEIRGPEKLDPVRSRLGPFYADELAWLYNELGLVSYSKGVLPDAYVLFRLGQDVNRNADNGFRGHRWCQAELNLAAVQIERARLPRAMLHLTNALRAAKTLRDEDMTARCLLYLGLIHHLRGDYDNADAIYSKSLEKLRGGVASHRGISIVKRHRADLMRVQGRIKEAEASLSGSVMAAESGAHLDLLWYARIAEANLRRRVDSQSSAGEALESALVFARSAGIPKLEAEVYAVQAHVALDHGETEAASRLAVRCLSLGSAFGMRLRVTAALVLLGHVYRCRSQRIAAKGIYQAACLMGSRQGYQLKVEEATREMLKMESSS